MELTQRGRFLWTVMVTSLNIYLHFLLFSVHDASPPVLCTYIITKQQNIFGCEETLHVTSGNQHFGEHQNN